MSKEVVVDNLPLAELEETDRDVDPAIYLRRLDILSRRIVVLDCLESGKTLGKPGNNPVLLASSRFIALLRNMDFSKLVLGGDKPANSIRKIYLNNRSSILACNPSWLLKDTPIKFQYTRKSKVNTVYVSAIYTMAVDLAEKHKNDVVDPNFPNEHIMLPHHFLRLLYLIFTEIEDNAKVLLELDQIINKMDIDMGLSNDYFDTFNPNGLSIFNANNMGSFIKTVITQLNKLGLNIPENIMESEDPLAAITSLFKNSGSDLIERATSYLSADGQVIETLDEFKTKIREFIATNSVISEITKVLGGSFGIADIDKILDSDMAEKLFSIYKTSTVEIVMPDTDQVCE